MGYNVAILVYILSQSQQCDKFFKAQATAGMYWCKSCLICSPGPTPQAGKLVFLNPDPEIANVFNNFCKRSFWAKPIIWAHENSIMFESEFENPSSESIPKPYHRHSSEWPGQGRIQIPPVPSVQAPPWNRTSSGRLLSDGVLGTNILACMGIPSTHLYYPTPTRWTPPPPEHPHHITYPTLLIPNLVNSEAICTAIWLRCSI